MVCHREMLLTLIELIFFSPSCSAKIISLVMVVIGVYARTVKHAGK